MATSKSAVATENGKTARVAKESGPIELRRIEQHTVDVPIVGVTELIVNKFSNKARQMMLDKQMAKTRTKKEPKDPVADYEAAMHKLADGRHGFPASGFKGAIVEGARLFDNITMAGLQRFVWVIGEPDEEGNLLVPIVGEPHMREDPVRNATGVADIRFRPGYWPWSAVLRVQFVASVITPDAIVNLVEAGGICGIGDWRPSSKMSKTGMYGKFRVDA